MLTQEQLGCIDQSLKHLEQVEQAVEDLYAILPQLPQTEDAIADMREATQSLRTYLLSERGEANQNETHF